MVASGEVWVLCCKVMPDAEWDVMAWGFGEDAEEELSVMAQALRDGSGCEEWRVMRADVLREVKEQERA